MAGQTPKEPCRHCIHVEGCPENCYNAEAQAEPERLKKQQKTLRPRAVRIELDPDSNV